jgi:hypothetical protein
MLTAATAEAVGEAAGAGAAGTEAEGVETVATLQAVDVAVHVVAALSLESLAGHTRTECDSCML